MTTTLIDAIDAPWEPTPDDGLPEFSAGHARSPALAEFASRLGNTSLREVPGPSEGVRVLAKCEWENPFGSIKDRVGYALVCDLLQHQDPRQLKVLEYSGGNLAKALAGLAAMLGFRLRVVLSSASAPSLLAELASNNTEVDLVDKDRGFLAVMQHAVDIAQQDPSWSLLYQHRNPVNLACHQTTTGRELVEQLGSTVPDVWVASIGTGGTLVGVLNALRRVHPGIRAIGVTPQELPYGSAQPANGLPKYGGSGGLGHGIRQPFVHRYDNDIAEHRTISFPLALQGMAEFFDLTGVRIGSSSAANWLVARDIASTLPKESTVVTVFPCAGTPEEWSKAGR